MGVPRSSRWLQFLYQCQNANQIANQGFDDHLGDRDLFNLLSMSDMHFYFLKPQTDETTGKAVAACIRSCCSLHSQLSSPTATAGTGTWPTRVCAYSGQLHVLLSKHVLLCRKCHWVPISGKKPRNELLVRDGSARSRYRTLATMEATAHRDTSFFHRLVTGKRCDAPTRISPRPWL